MLQKEKKLDVSQGNFQRKKSAGGRREKGKESTLTGGKERKERKRLSVGQGRKRGSNFKEEGGEGERKKRGESAAADKQTNTLLGRLKVSETLRESERKRKGERRR